MTILCIFGYFHLVNVTWSESAKLSMYVTGAGVDAKRVCWAESVVRSCEYTSVYSTAFFAWAHESWFARVLTHDSVFPLRKCVVDVRTCVLVPNSF